MIRFVCLFLFILAAIYATIAYADTAVLYYAGPAKSGYHATPAAACAAEFEGASTKQRGDGSTGDCIKINQAGNTYVLGYYASIQKTCEAKELTHDGTSNGAPAPLNQFWEKSLDGIDASDWFPDSFNTCENNCVVKNKRIPLVIPEKIPDGVYFNPNGKSIREKDGKSWSKFSKNQTGSVCVNEPKKKDEPPKPPAPADDADDGKQPNGGQGSGNNSSSGQSGSGSSNGTGSGSEGSGNTDNGNNGNGGSSGSNGGGSQGGGGTTGVPGGGTSGGQNGNGSADGGESGNGSGNGQGEDSGSDSGGEGSDQTGGNGTVDGGESNQDGSGGEDDKEGGSISGGNCAADQAPSCKGDPIQCYIAVEQWRTACAASGEGNSIAGGNCKTNTPPECKGDPAQCYIAKQNFEQTCAAQAAQERFSALDAHGKSQQSYMDELGRDGNPEGILDGLKTDKIDLTGQINSNLVKLPNTCPAFPPLDLGMWGKHEIPSDHLCDIARVFGRILLAMSYIVAFGIIVRYSS